jgi:prepilin peptidase CpaA
LNLVTLAPAWLLILFACALLAAAIEDAMRLRISNLTCLAVLAGAIVAAVVAGPTWGLWQNGAVFAILLMLGTVAFSAGWLGGGDVKLFAATGLWFDLGSALPLVALVFLSGGLVAICYVLSRPLRLRRTGQSKWGQVPYGIAIAVGALAMLGLDARALGHHGRPLPPIKIVRGYS